MRTRIQPACLAMLLGLYSLSLLATTACFSPTFQEGLVCSESGECPGDLTCIADRCVSGGSQTFPDSGVDVADAAPGAPDAALCESGSTVIEATGAIVDFAVPDCITVLTIEAFGAEGGGGVNAVVLGGKGARIKGDIDVFGGEVLNVLVGVRGIDAVQQGANAIGEQGGGTGGGGTFIVDENGLALMVAGGGGGATHNEIISPQLIPGGDGSILSSGQDGGGTEQGVGGAGGSGGTTNDNGGFHGGTGGGGFSTAGVGNSAGAAEYGTANTPGASYLDGGAGGGGGSEGRNGGFGGGGSLNTGANQDDSPGVRTGDGQVIISWSR